jgi:hypothetical protein
MIFGASGITILINGKNLRSIRGCTGALLVSALILFGVSEAFPQPLFPLAVGNRWHYSITHVYPPPALSPQHYTFGVIGDTLMANGQRFAVLDNPDVLGARFIRADSAVIYYWADEKEHRVFNLRAAAGVVDSISFGGFTFARSNGSVPGPIFGRSVNITGFALGGLLFGGVTIAEGFGYYSYDYDADWGTTQDTWLLQGCTIGDTSYGNVTGVTPPEQWIPEQVELLPNYPNPFNGATTLRYRLPSEMHLRLIIRDMLGREIAKLVDGVQAQGEHTINYEPAGMASGLYYSQLSTAAGLQVRALLYLR